MAMTLNNRIHVLGRHEDLRSVSLEGKTVIVLDILFATSTIVTVLAHGAAAVIPVLDETAARERAATLEADTTVLAGEHNAITLPGFAPPTPLALMHRGIAGKTIVYSTTNGTVAIGSARGAARIYAAGLLNAGATVAHLARSVPEAPILIVCAGSMGHFNLEDFAGAGYLVDLMAGQWGEGIDLSDAALAARRVYRSAPAAELLRGSRVGRMFADRGLEEEILHAAGCSTLDVVVRLDGERLARVGQA
jgi:2-phosphosulfolactate phosphatase